jgi:hypothetical protein
MSQSLDRRIAALDANSGVMSPTIPTNPRPAFRDEVARDSEMMSPTVSTISRGARAVIGRV